MVDAGEDAIYYAETLDTGSRTQDVLLGVAIGPSHHAVELGRNNGILTKRRFLLKKTRLPD